MKRICSLLLALAPLAATAQEAPAVDTLRSQLSSQLKEASSRLSVGAKPNEIVKGSVTYSGIAVAVIKTDNVLQLFNPAAPARYGSPEDSVLGGSNTGSGLGWKLFSIRF